MEYINNTREQDNAETKEYRVWLRDTEHKIADSFRKTVLTIAGGSLALSITFIKNIVGSGKMVGEIWLFLSWFCLTTCLILVIWTYHYGLKAYRMAYNQAISDENGSGPTGGIYATILRIFNPAGIWFLTVGLALLLIFTCLNFVEGV